MDSANFSGITCPDPLVEVDESAREIDMNWNIATFLPDAIRPVFREIVAAFVHGMHMAKVETTDAYRTPFRVLQNATQTQPDPTKAQEHDLAKQFVQHKMTRQLLKAVQTLQRQHAEDAPDVALRRAWLFPQLPGSHLPMKNPILECIKFVCAVLALSREVNAEVGVLRRNLLDLISVKEYVFGIAFILR